MVSFLKNGLLGMGGLSSVGGAFPPEGLLGPYYNQAQMKGQMLKQGLLRAGVDMLRNGRGSTGEVIGNAFAGGLEGADAAKRDYMQQSLGFNELAKKNKQEAAVQQWLNTLDPKERMLATAYPERYAEQFLQSKFAEAGNSSSGIFGNVYWDKQGNPYALDKTTKGMKRVPVEGDAQLIRPDEMTGLKENAMISPRATRAMINEWFKKDGIRDKTARATAGLQSIQQAQTMLKRGIQTGFGADIIQSWRSAGQLMGFTVDEEKLKNTQAYQDFIMNTVVPRMAELGGNDSEEELRAMMRTTGGDITRQAEVLGRTLALIEQVLQRNVEEGVSVYESIKPYVGDYNPAYGKPSAPLPGEAPQDNENNVLIYDPEIDDFAP